jgi:hypothetical protein
MRKIIFKSVSFRLLLKKGARFRGVRKPKASQRPWRAKRAATIWFALFCAYGSATATTQYKWDVGFEFLSGVFFQGTGAGLLAVAIAAYVCIAHNRKSSTQNIKRRSTSVYRGRLERLRPYFVSPSDIKAP